MSLGRYGQFGVQLCCLLVIAACFSGFPWKILLINHFWFFPRSPKVTAIQFLNLPSSSFWKHEWHLPVPQRLACLPFSMITQKFLTVLEHWWSLLLGLESLGCDSGSMFNFTLSLLSDFFPGLGCWDQTYFFFQVVTLHVQKKKKL